MPGAERPAPESIGLEVRCIPQPTAVEAWADLDPVVTGFACGRTGRRPPEGGLLLWGGIVLFCQGPVMGEVPA
jgi:hypothetical protein